MLKRSRLILLAAVLIFLVCISASAVSAAAVDGGYQSTSKETLSISSRRKAVTIYAGKIKYRFVPTVTGYTGTVKFRSLNPEIAVVSKNGVITGRSRGKTIIQAYFKTGGKNYKVTLKVTVKNKSVVELTDFYDWKYDEITSSFPGGNYQTQYAEYNTYIYKNRLTFSFSKPADMPSVSIMSIKARAPHFSICGIRYGMIGEMAVYKAQQNGFGDIDVIGETLYMENDEKMVNIRISTKGGKVEQVTYGRW